MMPGMAEMIICSPSIKMRSSSPAQSAVSRSSGGAFDHHVDRPPSIREEAANVSAVGDVRRPLYFDGMVTLLSVFRPD
jgi:hypothetical protein